MPRASSFFRQLSGRESWKSTSRRWVGGGGGNNKKSSCEGGLGQMEGLSNMYGGGDNHNNGGGGGGGGGMAMRKRVMVVVDESSHSKHAMMWALTHVANKGDLLTLLHILPSSHHPSSSSSSPHLANSLGSLCKACKPEVEVEALVIQGPRLGTVSSQVKKLEVSVLVLGQKKPSSLTTCFFGRSKTEEFVEHCINNVECLTIGVRKQSKGVSGYLINTRWQKDFWLLA